MALVAPVSSRDLRLASGPEREEDALLVEHAPGVDQLTTPF
jgi:hypothetical protein